MRACEPLGGSPTLANLGNDRGFISKEYIIPSTDMRSFGETQSKAQYHIIVEIRDS